MNQAKTIRLFLLGLPLGLVATGVISLVHHSASDSEDPELRVVQRLAKQTITEDSLRRSLETLSVTIGPRHLDAHPDKLVIAANYIESTVGPLNMGYEVVRQPYAVGGKAVENLSITLRGGKLIHEVVVVCAHYDAERESPGANDNGTGVAALFAIAETFVNQHPDRTIRFVFLANGATPYGGTPEAGAATYLKHRVGLGDSIIAAICLDGLGRVERGVMRHEPPLDDYFPQHGNFLAVAGPPSASELIRDLSGTPSAHLDLAVQSTLFDRDYEVLLGRSMAGAFSSAGIPSVLVRSGGSFAPKPDETDELAKVDLPAFTGAVQWLVAAIDRLANPRSR